MDDWIENPRDIGETLDRDDELYPLKLFNVKTKKLLNTRFGQFVLEKARTGEQLSSGLHIEFDKPIKFVRNYPPDNYIDEYLFTFRFFWEKDNVTSFLNLDKVYPKLLISNETKKKYRETSDLYQKLRKEIIPFNLHGRITREELVDTWMKGDYSHADKPRFVKRVNALKRNQFLYEELWSKFIFILALALRLICYVADINGEAIKSHESSKTDMVMR